MTLKPFDNEKQQTLRKLATIDKSKKGSLDTLIVPIITLLNQHGDYYTTSSCSGRIMVLKTVEGRRKDQTKWLYTTHFLARRKDIISSLSSESTQSMGTIWLKQESAILHVACRDMTCAERLLDIVRGAGFKRAGIIATSRRVMLEIIGTDAIALPLGTPQKIVAPTSFLSYLIPICNSHMKSNLNKLSVLQAALTLRLS